MSGSQPCKHASLVSREVVSASVSDPLVPRPFRRLQMLQRSLHQRRAILHGLRYLGAYLDGNGTKRRRPDLGCLAFPARSCYTVLHTLPLRARFALVPNDEVGGPPLPLVSPVHAVCSACAAQQNDA